MSQKTGGSSFEPGPQATASWPIIMKTAIRMLVAAVLSDAAVQAPVAFAASIQSVQNGDWSDSATWDLDRMPVAGDQVGIAAATTVTIAGTVAGGPSLRVASGGALSIGASGQMTLCSTCQLDNSGTIEVNGSLHWAARARPTTTIVRPSSSARAAVFSSRPAPRWRTRSAR
jgi:hypothetical protein